MACTSGNVTDPIS